MVKEINLAFLFKILKSAWWKILIFTVVIAIAVAAVTEFVIPKKYSSTTEFYVLNTSTTSEYTTTALLSAAEYLANDYIEIILGDDMIQTIIADLTTKGYECTPAAIRSMISSSTSADSSTFKITTTHTDKDIAFYVADSIKKNAPDVIKSVTRPSYTSSLYRKTTTQDPETGNSVDNYVQISEEDLECVKVIRSPELSKTHVSPSVSKNTLIAAVLAAILAYLFFLVRKLLDTTIRNEDNAKELVNETIIGDIPAWDINTSKDGKDKKEEK